jgi:hypothetical protein
MLPRKPPVFAEVTVSTRSDVCPYLDYLVDLHGAEYNIYHCSLEGSDHKCQYMGWCPVAASDGFENKRIYTLQDTSCKVRYHNRGAPDENNRNTQM